jgi:NAD(P)H-hydrate repair Nnr-like enzyme with NAD(P)H-hydrate epimerase domain
MIKIVSNAAMSRLESIAYQQGYKEDAFMEKAGEEIAKATQRFVHKKNLAPQIVLLCGKGNNGGDAFVAGRYLLQNGYIVKAIQLEKTENCSPLCQKNQRLFIEKGGVVVQQLSFFEESVIFLDGLFGTGLIFLLA